MFSIRLRQRLVLTRERVRDRCAGGSWDRFADMLVETEPGNGGNLGFFIDEPEITPPILKTGTYRFAPDDAATDFFEQGHVAYLAANQY